MPTTPDRSPDSLPNEITYPDSDDVRQFLVEKAADYRKRILEGQPDSPRVLSAQTKLLLYDILAAHKHTTFEGFSTIAHERQEVLQKPFRAVEALLQRAWRTVKAYVTYGREAPVEDTPIVMESGELGSSHQGELEQRTEG